LISLPIFNRNKENVHTAKNKFKALSEF